MAFYPLLPGEVSYLSRYMLSAEESSAQDNFTRPATGLDPGRKPWIMLKPVLPSMLILNIEDVPPAFTFI